MDAQSGVVFHEDQNFDPIPIVKPEPKTFSRHLMTLGVVNSPGDVAIVMAIFAAVLIGANVYLFAKSIPEPPVLGEDSLRSGEVVPEYTNPR